MFTITGPSNIQLDFCQRLYEKTPGKIPCFKRNFESTDKVLPLHQYLWFEISGQWNNGSLNFFENFHGRALCFLNFVKWASILLILLKCIAVGCSYGNESFTGWLFSDYRPLNMLLHFFDIIYIVFFTRILSKSLWKAILFQLEIQNAFQDVVY